MILCILIGRDNSLLWEDNGLWAREIQGETVMRSEMVMTWSSEAAEK